MTLESIRTSYIQTIGTTMSTACLTRTGKRVSTLVDRIMKQNNRKWYHLYMDRYYNSAGLMLFGKHRMGFYCSGTCHVNHSGLVRKQRKSSAHSISNSKIVYKYIILNYLRLYLLPDTEGDVSAHFSSDLLIFYYYLLARVKLALIELSNILYNIEIPLNKKEKNFYEEDCKHFFTYI